ncbi:MAG: hypothetical protein ACRELD_14240 [Longimicrobiales bacterium]
MRRFVLLLATATAALSTAACGGGAIDVVAQLEQTSPEGQQDTVALSELPVWLLPYDRDAIFDSLQAAYPEPEPEIPDSILEIQDQIASAQQEWQDAETSWATARDSLQRLSQRLQNMNRGSAQYRVLFNDFGTLEDREGRARQQMEEAFARFTGLQTRLNNVSAEIRARRETWGDRAFEQVDSIMLARAEDLGREEFADTTNSAGVAQFRGVPTGQWWVYSRYELPYNELYWNLPIQVEGGDPVRVLLNRETAELRTTL